MKPLFLASKSPRRATLLSHLGLTFEVRTPHGREISLTSGTDEEIINTVHENAMRKALSITSSIDSGFVLSGDTLVVTDENKVLGKPVTSTKAFQMLQTLAGKTHRVISSVVLIDLDLYEAKVGHTWTQVSFRRLSDNEIQTYISTKEPFDKAGAYAIQGSGGILVESIEGSYTAIIGLPIELVVSFLSQFGVQPSQY